MTENFPNTLTKAQFDALSQFVKTFKNKTIELQARKFFSDEREELLQTIPWEDKRNLLRTEERFKQVFEAIKQIGNLSTSNATGNDVDLVLSLFKRQLPENSVEALKLIHADNHKVAEVSRMTGFTESNLRRTSKNFLTIKSDALKASKLFVK